MFCLCFIYFSDFCQTNYLSIYRTVLHKICRVGRTLAVDERSKVIFSICQRSLSWHPIFCLLNPHLFITQEAQLLPRDRVMRHVSWNLANCHATVQKSLVWQVLNKLTLWSCGYHAISIYRDLAVAKFFKVHNVQIAHVTLTTSTSGTLTHHKTKTSHGRHTHPFNSLLSGTAWVSRYQKGKTNLDFTEAREWVAVAFTGPYASLHLAPDRYCLNLTLNLTRFKVRFWP